MPVADRSDGVPPPRGAALPARRRVVLWVVLALATAAAVEGTARVAFALVPRFEKTRALLAGEALEASIQGTIGQAYLHYVPAPGFRSEGVVQHNAEGYRGRAVRLERTPGVARVLCLGGSTTYGWGEPDPDQSYPAHLERLLAESRPAGWGRVEVINAGLPWGTTAELLNHYALKFAYYAPDVVIVNAGGNDAQGTVLPRYQPDYSHWRQPLALPRPLPERTRWLLRSRALAAGVVGLLYDPAPDTSSFVAPEGRVPPVRWYTRGPRPRDARAGVAFERNLRVLVDTILADGSAVLLVPFRTRWDHSYPPAMMEVIAEEERFTEELAGRKGVAFAPFPREVISPGNWVDKHCHTNAEGNREKAAHLVPYVSRLLAERQQAVGAR